MYFLKYIKIYVSCIPRRVNQVRLFIEADFVEPMQCQRTYGTYLRWSSTIWTFSIQIIRSAESTISLEMCFAVPPNS